MAPRRHGSAQPLRREHARLDVHRERHLLLRGQQLPLAEQAQVAAHGVDFGLTGRSDAAALRVAGARAVAPLAHPPDSCPVEALSWVTSNATTVSDRTNSRAMANALYFSPTSGVRPIAARPATASPRSAGPPHGRRVGPSRGLVHPAQPRTVERGEDVDELRAVVHACSRSQMGRTAVACGPFWPTTSNSTCWPSSRLRKPCASITEWWTKTSGPVLRDEAVALLVVEPLDGSLCHGRAPVSRRGGVCARRGGVAHGIQVCAPDEISRSAVPLRRRRYAIAAAPATGPGNRRSMEAECGQHGDRAQGRTRIAPPNERADPG